VERLLDIPRLAVSDEAGESAQRLGMAEESEQSTTLAPDEQAARLGDPPARARMERVRPPSRRLRAQQNGWRELRAQRVEHLLPEIARREFRHGHCVQSRLHTGSRGGFGPARAISTSQQVLDQRLQHVPADQRQSDL